MTVHPPHGPLVVCPYVPHLLTEATRKVVTTARAEWNLVQLDPGNPYAYGQLLCHLWEMRRTFVIVEHDMAPTPGQLDALLHCGHEWCGYPYLCGDTLVSMSLGVARFSASVMERWPTLGRQAAMVAGDQHRPTPWSLLAENLAGKMLTLGYTWVGHHGQVEHLHQRGAY